MQRNEARRIGLLLVMAVVLGAALPEGATAQTSAPMTGPINLGAPPPAPSPAPATPQTAPRAAAPSSPLASPTVLAPMVITPPPTAAQREREAERAERDLERRQRLNEPVDERPTQLGAPTFVQPGTTPYAAPQYPAGTPAYTNPAYGNPGNAAQAGRACRQMAPAYDESGRFLANVCIR
jgi:hypothetical protein